MQLKSEKGQDIVEFAFILPFFLLLIMGIVYVGFLFTDYLNLSNLARSSAREASIQATGQYDNGADAIQAKYNEVQNKYAERVNDIQHMYVVDSSGFRITPDYKGNKVEDVHVVIQARLDTSDGVSKVIENFIPEEVKNFTIEYRMYQDRMSHDE